MDRKNLFKFGFILVVALMVVVVSLYSFFGGKKDSENIEDMFEIDEDVEDDFNIDDYDFDIDDDNDVDEDNTNKEVSEVEGENQVDEGDHDDLEDYATIDEEFNYEQKYIDRFGKEALDRTLALTQKVIPIYLKKESDLKEVKEDFTTNYMKDFSSLIEKEKKSKAKGIESLEVFATEQVNDDEIIIGCIANYDDKTEFFNVVFVNEDDVFLIDNVISMWSN